ncbi:MAG: hypothetical protein PWP64_517 [Candidatus Cloacimonadota bacterium]|nr:hypothetical protein [Candidatus Cloacimonadota bacterium]
MKRKTLFILLALWLLASTFIGLNSWGVQETSEARYAEISREMLSSGDWLHPRLLEIGHYHKPPVTYWLTAISMKIAGVSAGGARFLMQICFLLQVLLVYQIAKRYWGNEKTAFLAAGLFVLMPLQLMAVRNVTTDLYLAGFELAAIFFFMQYYLVKQYKWLYAALLSMGLAFLTKGPVGLLFPLLSVIPFKRKWGANPHPQVLHTCGAILLAVLISISWYLVMVINDPTFLRYFLFRHTLERFAGASVFSRNEPFWYFLVLVPATLLMPFFALVHYLVKTGKRLFKDEHAYFIFWLIVVPMIFFSISSSKRILYVLPLAPLTAILAAGIIASYTEKLQIKFLRIMLAIWGLFPLAFIIAPLFMPELHATPYLIGLSVLMLAVVITAILRLAKQPLVVSGAMSFILCGLLMVSSSVILGQRDSIPGSSRSLAKWIEQNTESEKVIVYDKLLPSLAFELQRPIVSLHNRSKHLQRETAFEPDDRYKNYLVEYADSAAVKSLIQQPSIMLVWKDIDAQAQWMRSYYTTEQRIGKWVILYRKDEA